MASLYDQLEMRQIRREEVRQERCSDCWNRHMATDAPTKPVALSLAQFLNEEQMQNERTQDYLAEQGLALPECNPGV